MSSDFSLTLPVHKLKMYNICLFLFCRLDAKFLKGYHSDSISLFFPCVSRMISWCSLRLCSRSTEFSTSFFTEVGSICRKMVNRQGKHWKWKNAALENWTTFLILLTRDFSLMIPSNRKHIPIPIFRAAWYARDLISNSAKRCKSRHEMPHHKKGSSHYWTFLPFSYVLQHGMCRSRWRGLQMWKEMQKSS